MGRRKAAKGSVTHMRQRVLVTWLFIVVFLLGITYFYRCKSQENVYLNSIEHFEKKYCKHIYGDVAIVQLVTGSHYINRTVNNALVSLRCYAKLRNYTLYQIRVESDKIISLSGFNNTNTKVLNGVEEICQGYPSLMITRHCVVSYLLQSYDYVVHLDGDTGVVNPNHCFEEYITPSLDMILLMRIHSGEIQAGNYIAKSTKFSQAFLKTWLKNTNPIPPDSESVMTNLPTPPPPNDQEALHRTLSQYYLSTKEAELCSSALVPGQQPGYFRWVNCIVRILHQKSKHKEPEKHVKIYNRAHGFVRDGWYTKYLWSNRDFLFHAMKNEDDVLFDRVLRPQDCISNVWELPIKGEYYVPNERQMERIWYSIDERQFKLFQFFALISKISDCWPYCQNIVL